MLRNVNECMKTKIFSIFVFAFVFSFCAEIVFARENVTDWYIKNFETEIVVNKDSTLDITEWITADCGNAAGKHGIFRILPEDVKIEDKSMSMPIELVDITDFSGLPLKYSESKGAKDKTVTWKIGDPNVTVSGVNNYIIRYRVKNAVRFSNDSFDELYWNLNGNFWDLETDKFHAKIVFPEEITKDNSKVEYYTGLTGEKRKDLAAFYWSAPNVLEFDSTKTLLARQGITASVIFPKNIISPHKFGFWELYGKYFWLLIPLAVFVVCFFLWWKYGKDPKVNKTIMPEYEAPGNLTPMEIGMLKSSGGFNNSLITAEIINLATKGLISIEENDEKALFVNKKEYEFARLQNPEKENSLNKSQRMILEKIFEKGDVVKLSSLRSSFHKVTRDLKKATEDVLVEKKLIVRSALKLSIGFRITGGALIFASFFSLPISFWLAASSFVSGLIIFLFGLVMPLRTAEGADLYWKIKGFKLFMETVDKDRAKFYEKENIFEKFLPYAIVFGITDLWIKKMKEIYGEEYFATHAPVWYVGNAAAFNADNFSNTIKSLSNAIAMSTSSTSGSGGAGGSGGGGGGGGGGGW